MASYAWRIPFIRRHFRNLKVTEYYGGSGSMVLWVSDTT